MKEFLAFGSKTIMKRIGAGSQGVDYEGNMVFCHVQADGLGVVIFCDKEYPPRVAISLAKEVVAAFKALHECGRRLRARVGWRGLALTASLSAPSPPSSPPRSAGPRGALARPSSGASWPSSSRCSPSTPNRPRSTS